jgi:hypothetical protein
MDSNTVTISIASAYSSTSNITYMNNSLVVSAGQSHDSAPQTPTKNGNVWTIALNADRNGTSDIAQSFNTKAGGASHEYTNSSWWSLGSSPGDLNFYFGVNLTVGTETITVYLGQGHHGADQNNWWFGSSALIFVVPPNGFPPGFTPKLVIGDAKFAFQATGNSSFNLATWPPNS